MEAKHEEDHERDYEETGLEDDTTTKKVRVAEMLENG